METEFTPITSLLGGALIGLSAVLLMAMHGRIAGISGIVARMLPPSADKAGLPQGIIFVFGLLIAAPLLRQFSRFPLIQLQHRYSCQDFLSCVRLSPNVLYVLESF